MSEHIVSFFTQLHIPAQLAVFLIAMLPFTESQASIPVGIGVFGMHPIEAFIWSFIGNALVTLPIMFFLHYTVRFLMKHVSVANRFFTWLFDHTQKKHSKHFQLYGEIGLMLFTAIPFPVSGAWSGTLAAYVFGFPRKPTFWFIAAGLFISCIIVTLVSTGAFALFG